MYLSAAFFRYEMPLCHWSSSENLSRLGVCGLRFVSVELRVWVSYDSTKVERNNAIILIGATLSTMTRSLVRSSQLAWLFRRLPSPNLSNRPCCWLFPLLQTLYCWGWISATREASHIRLDSRITRARGPYWLGEYYSRLPYFSRCSYCSIALDVSIYRFHWMVWSSPTSAAVTMAGYSLPRATVYMS